MKFFYSKTFQKNAKALTQNKKSLEVRLRECIIDFETSLFQSKFYRKKLQGYESIHELELGGDIRIIVEVLIREDIATFLNIGTHSSLGIIGNMKKKKR